MSLIRVVESEHAEYLAARKRLTELKEVFSFNEAITMLARLIEEVNTMPVANRFSSQRKIYAVLYATAEEKIRVGVSTEIADMTEAQHKRWQLKKDLTEIQHAVLGLGSKFETVFMDMQATQIE